MPRPKSPAPRKASAARPRVVNAKPDKPGTKPKASKRGGVKTTTTRVVARRSLYDLVEQRLSMPGHGSVDVRQYVNKQGTPIQTQHKPGRKTGLVLLIEKHRIQAIKAQPSHSNCSIGKGEKGSWFGWSHRAACEFKKGDRVFEERYGNDDTPFTKHGRRTVKTDADARLAAKRFARSVS